MHKIANLLKRAIIDGFFVLLPLILLYLILHKVYTVTYALVEPLARKIPGNELLGIGISSWVALLTILLLLMLVGFVFRTRPGKSLLKWVYKNITSHIPGYQTLQLISNQFSGKSEEMLLSPALFSTDMGTYMIAFILDKHDNGFYSIYVPLVPTPLVGTVQYVEGSRVKKLDVPPGKILDILMKWGIGSKAAFNLSDYINK